MVGPWIVEGVERTSALTGRWSWEVLGLAGVVTASGLRPQGFPDKESAEEWRRQYLECEITVKPEHVRVRDTREGFYQRTVALPHPGDE